MKDDDFIMRIYKKEVQLKNKTGDQLGSVVLKKTIMSNGDRDIELSLNHYDEGEIGRLRFSTSNFQQYYDEFAMIVGEELMRIGEKVVSLPVIKDE